MSKILVTGASGDIGRKTLLHLLKHRPATDLIALVRDPAKAHDLASLGIEIRQGDYYDLDSLRRAFAGVEKLMLTATHAFTDRNTAHANVIDVAVEAGVKHLVFMPIQRREQSDFHMKEITDEDQFTEQKLQASGLTWTLVRHPPFFDILGFYLGWDAQNTGVQVPAGSGVFAAATRDDLAAAHAAILSQSGHENKAYVLTGGEAVSFADIAQVLSDIEERDVPYVPLSDEAYLDLKRVGGVPEFIVQFAFKWVQGMNAGEWSQVTPDLERLIGRKPTTAAEFFRNEYLKAGNR